MINNKINIGRSASSANPAVSSSSTITNYYSGTDARIYFGDIWVDEIVEIEFGLQEQVAPIYGYGSYTWDVVARGNRVVVGQFAINFKEVGYLQTILNSLSSAMNTREEDKWFSLDEFNGVDLKVIATGLKDPMRTFSLSRVGNSIVYTPGGVTTTNGHLPAHTNNFLEIMADGSARMRILLLNNDQNDTSVNMYVAISILQLYKEIYTQIMGKLFPNKMVYAKKYEALTVRKQFQPVILYDKNTLAMHPEYHIEHQKMQQELSSHQNIFGIATVITDDRIPKTGLYTVDKRQLEIWGEEYTSESIINELFRSGFTLLGAVFPPEDE
ncbi:MAG: hypothetical protein ACI4E0_04930 [Blautia sp.]